METVELLETPLASEHLRLGARMVSFAGWRMPLQYPSGILEEHHHTRRSVSLFDTCHMSEFRIFGPGSSPALDRLMARDVLHQAVGACRYNFMMSPDGGIRDDLILYRLAEEEFLLVGNAGTHDKDLEWIKESLDGSVKFTDESSTLGKLDLQGPEAAEALKSFGLSADSLPAYFHWKRAAICGEQVLISRTGYTGELGFEIYMDLDRVETVWKTLLESPSTKPAGLGARDTLRLEAGLPLYGQDLGEDTTPVEAGFGAWIRGDRQFVGSEALKDPPRKHCVGIALSGRRAARHGMDVFSESGRRIGHVTSGSFAPSLGYAVALAFIEEGGSAGEGTTVLLDTADGRLTGRITGLPFYRTGTVRKRLSESR